MVVMPVPRVVWATISDFLSVKDSLHWAIVSSAIREITKGAAVVQVQKQCQICMQQHRASNAGDRALIPIVHVLNEAFSVGLEVTHPVIGEVVATVGEDRAMLDFGDALNDELEEAMRDACIPDFGLVQALLIAGARPDRMSERRPLETLLDHLETRRELMGPRFADASWLLRLAKILVAFGCTTYDQFGCRRGTHLTSQNLLQGAMWERVWKMAATNGLANEVACARYIYERQSVGDKLNRHCDSDSYDDLKGWLRTVLICASGDSLLLHGAVFALSTQYLDEWDACALAVCTRAMTRPQTLSPSTKLKYLFMF